MSDLTIVLNATGNLDSQVAKAVAQIQKAAEESKKPGKQFGDGFAGAMERLRHYSQEMNKYLAAGAGVYRIAQAGIDTWASMHEAAAARINKANKEVFETQRKIYEGEVKQRAKSWENTQLSTILRMSGVDNDNRGAAIMGSLQSLAGPIGEQIRTQLFPKIAQQIASLRLSGSDTTDALQRAATGLNQYGHVPGYGDAYADLAGVKGMAGRENLSDMALALSLRRARLSEAESTRLTEGMQSGAIRVGDDGELRGGGAMSDLVKLVNGMGGLALRGAVEAWKPGDTRLTGMHIEARPGEGAAYRLSDDLRGAAPVAPKQPDQVDKDEVSLSDITFKDVIKSLSVLAQQAGAAAIAIGVMAAAARLSGGGPGGSVPMPDGPGKPSAPGKPGGTPRGGIPWGRAARVGGAAALVAATAWGAYELAIMTDGQRDARNPPDALELSRRKALKAAQSARPDDDEAIRRGAAAGDPEMVRQNQLLEQILAEMKKGKQSNWDAFPLAPMAPAQAGE